MLAARFMQKHVKVLYAASIPPSTRSLLHSLRGSPAPVVLELHGRGTFRVEVADEMNIRVLVEIGIGVELPRHEVIDIPRV